MKHENDTHRYDDIINLPHPTSKKHVRMSLRDRAAQFAPFAALTGHDAAIKETGRFTDSRIELDDVMKSDLDMKLRIFAEIPSDSAAVSVTYFMPDGKKSGGKYVTAVGKVKKIDEYEHTLSLTDGIKIPIEDILNIKSELFKAFEQF